MILRKNTYLLFTLSPLLFSKNTPYQAKNRIKIRPDYPVEYLASRIPNTSYTKNTMNLRYEKGMIKNLGSVSSA